MSGACIFVVGAPRSGTTFLQNLLGAHPLIATSQETDFIDQYVAPWRRTWEAQLPPEPERWARWRHKGLGAVFTEPEFDDIVRDALARVREATLALKPGAEVFLDKTPANGLHAPLILRYLPSARFIHIVRDGRDVVSSMLRAGRGWGREWAPGDAEAAATAWRDFVGTCTTIRDQTDAYMEVRYEDLLGDDGFELLRVSFAFCGVATTDEDCRRLMEGQRGAGSLSSSLVWGGEVMHRLGGAPPEPAGFAGEGGVGAWRRDLDRRDRVVVEQAAGELLRSLDYTSGRDWLGLRSGEHGLVVSHLLLTRINRHMRWRIAKWLLSFDRS